MDRIIRFPIFHADCSPSLSTPFFTGRPPRIQCPLRAWLLSGISVQFCSLLLQPYFCFTYSFLWCLFAVHFLHHLLSPCVKRIYFCIISLLITLPVGVTVHCWWKVLPFCVETFLSPLSPLTLPPFPLFAVSLVSDKSTLLCLVQFSTPPHDLRYCSVINSTNCICLYLFTMVSPLREGVQEAVMESTHKMERKVRHTHTLLQWFNSSTLSYISFFFHLHLHKCVFAPTSEVLLRHVTSRWKSSRRCCFLQGESER